MSNVVEFQTKKEVVFVTLNRPEKRNALNPELIKTLLSFFKEKKWSSSVKAIVLSGNGKAFCSGADLKWLKQEAVFTGKELENLFSLFSTIEACPLPVVTQVHGFAVGGALGLISVSDVVLAEKNSRFYFSETRLGLVPSIISSFVLKKIGLSQAKFLMLSALPFSADKAYEIGLSHFVGDQSECDVFLKKLIGNFKELDTFAVSQTKKWLNSIYSLPTSQVKSDSIKLISDARKTNSARKRINLLLNPGSKKQSNT